MKYFVLFILLNLNLLAYERIITLSPSVNEIVYALKADDKIIANSTYCNFPKDSLKKQKVGGYFSPNLEKIISLNPDLVIMPQHFKFSKKLNKFGIKTHVVKIGNLKNIKKTIIDIGDLLNKKNEANKIITNLNKALKNTKNIVKNKKILFVIGHNKSLVKRIFITGNDIYFEDIIKISGNTNAYQSKVKSQPVLNYENIIALNADIVILLTPYIKANHTSKEELLAPWKDLPINASKTNSIYFIDKEYSGIPSNRIIYFLQDFRDILIHYKNHVKNN